MKTTNLISVSVTIWICAVVFLPGQAYAQSAGSPDVAGETPATEQPDRYGFDITEQDYACLKSLDCLRYNQNLRDRGWKISLRNNMHFPDAFVLRGSSKQMEVLARYNRNGELTEGKIHRKNTVLPLSVRQFIASGQYEGWTMIENEIIVRDFETEKTRYRVVLERDGNQEILFFDHEGKPIEQIVSR